MPRPVVFIDASSRWPLNRRLTLAGAAVGAMAVVIWWAMTPATAEHTLLAQPAKAQWAGSASPFAPVSADATPPASSATAPAVVVTPPPPVATLGAHGVHVTPMTAPAGMAAAPAEPEAQDTEAEN